MSDEDRRLARHRQLAQVAAAHDAWVLARERVVHRPADANPGERGTDYAIHHVDRSASEADDRLELVDAKAFNPGQPRYPGGAPAGLGGQWQGMPGGGSGSSRPRQRLPQIAGLDVELAGRDPAVRALIAANSSGPAPDPTRTRVLAARDAKGRPSAYVVWQSEDGGSVPKGTVHAVWVHRAHRGKGVGDALVQQAVALDPDVQPTPNPNARRAAATPAAPAVPAPPPAPAVTSAPRAARAPRAQAAGGAAPATGGYSGNFSADAKRIDSLQRRYMGQGQDTVSLHSRGGKYTRAREREQQDVIDHFLSQPNVKRDRKLLVLGGLPGSGKTTYLNSSAGQAELGIDLSEYVTVNADEVKAEMVARGMVPDYPGLTPDEAATLYHQESFEIAHSLMRQAARNGQNFVYDTSLKSSAQLGFATGAAQSTGKKWSTQLVFIDVSVQTAKDRAQARYEAGGRYMPLALIDGMRAYGGRAKSGPAEEFGRVKGQVDQWIQVDNDGAAPVVVRKG